ncbi:MAG: hypothetical protein FWE80_08055, partial [Oscillospiraceae bacterium]|nr:hypothetical protein [Oscillospiraceae bacterium]
MTIHYTVTERDIINFNLYHMNHSTVNRILNIFIGLLPAFLFIKGFIQSPPEFDNAVDNIMSYAILVLVIVLFSLLFYFGNKHLNIFIIKMQLKAGKKNDFIGEHTLTLYEDVLEENNVVMSTRMVYSAI